ncbi:hypothetical protein GCM10023238_08750 [Streptomyces heliomycini]
MAAPGAELDWRRLRRHLAEHLPTHLIPASFTELPELSLTSSGKVDLAALPAPRRAPPTTPRTTRP